jgi:hypothetical protein
MADTIEKPTDDKAIRRSERRLSIYLNDHLAGLTLGIELAKRASSENQGTPLGDWLDEVRRELEDDRLILERLMGQLGIRRNRIKICSAWVAEKIGRLKLNGQLTGHSPLSPLVELEGLSLGVSGVLGMWKALQQNLGDSLDGIDPDELARRGERQAEQLELYRLDAAAKALPSGVDS